jgi:hypothetical protein
LDQDGNLALNAWFVTPTKDLSVTSRFTVEMLRQNPFDYVLTGESLNLPLWYAEPLCAALTPYRHDAHVAESVKQFAKSAAASAQWNTRAEPANLSKLPPVDPSLRFPLAVGPNVEPAGRILPRSGGPILRCLPRDGNRRQVRQRL